MLHTTTAAGVDTAAPPTPQAHPTPTCSFPISPSNYHHRVMDVHVEDLFRSELDHCSHQDYLRRLRHRLLDSAARRNASNWILKVYRLHHFQPVTAYLAVHFMDRFLSCHGLPTGSGEWPSQLLAVACLSVAAKLEETRVPLLINLQVMEVGFMFDAKTVMRMELFLMAALEWRMRAVTPFDYLYLLADGVAGAAPLRQLLFRSSELIVATRREVDFLAYRPSVVCAAAVLCSVREIGILSGDVDVFLARFSALIDKMQQDAVNACIRSMDARLLNNANQASDHFGTVTMQVLCPACRGNTLPVASKSRDMRPPNKRRKLANLECPETEDTLQDDRNPS